MRNKQFYRRSAVTMTTSAEVFATSSSNRGEQSLSRDLAIVAHVDDDLLFMNPDIMTSIHDGNTVRTFYMTAMIAADEDNYWRNREIGVKSAYAFMAGVRDQWRSSDYVLNGNSCHLEWLEDAPQVSLIFLRLPDVADPRPGVVTFRSFDDAAGAGAVIETIDGRARFTQQQLLKHLSSLIAEFTPSVVRLQDWQTTEDYDREITVLEMSDHPDHIRTARIARQAARNYPGEHQTIYYRNYNISYDPPNLAPEIVRKKRTAFLLYAQYDSLINGEVGRPHASPLSHYEPWLERQYTAPVPSDSGRT